MGDENSGGNGILGVPPTDLSGESNPSNGEDVLLSEYSFKDDVFVGSEKDKDPKESRLERRKILYVMSMLKLREQVMMNLTLTLPRMSLKSFRRRIRAFKPDQ